MTVTTRRLSDTVVGMVNYKELFQGEPLSDQTRIYLQEETFKTIKMAQHKRTVIITRVTGRAQLTTGANASSMLRRIRMPRDTFFKRYF